MVNSGLIDERNLIDIINRTVCFLTIGKYLLIKSMNYNVKKYMND